MHYSKKKDYSILLFNFKKKKIIVWNFKKYNNYWIMLSNCSAYHSKDLLLGP